MDMDSCIDLRATKVENGGMLHKLTMRLQLDRKTSFFKIMTSTQC